MSRRHTGTQRSKTGNHILLPADSEHQFVRQVAISSDAATVSSWTFGSGTVIWKIWPAMLFHTVFGALVTSLSLTGVLGFSLAIPNVMMTILGVVIGFVLSYRVSSGYDRYWLGRSYWSDIVRDTRILSRLIWFHIPLLLSPRKNDEPIPQDAVERVMQEKKTALDLVIGFTVALKHYLRGEYGIYYEDLYRLVQPLHEEDGPMLVEDDSDATPVPRSPIGGQKSPPSVIDPVIPPVNSYGGPSSQVKYRINTSHTAQSGYASSCSTSSTERTPLLPSAPRVDKKKAFGSEISANLIPFITFFSWCHRLISPSARRQYEDTIKQKPSIASKHRLTTKESMEDLELEGIERNIPLAIVRSLSEYFAVLEARGVVPGTSLGGMIGSLQMLEDALSGLERILTTPLPWAYNVHIRHSIWIYLFCLPFQLIGSFGWYTIPGTALAAFYFLGFLAAGEEIEQPFGYDENDLDIESFIDVIEAEMKTLKSIACPNVVISSSFSSSTVAGGKRRSVEVTSLKKVEKERGKRKQKQRQALMDVFGEI